MVVWRTSEHVGHTRNPRCLRCKPHVRVQECIVGDFRDRVWVTSCLFACSIRSVLWGSNPLPSTIRVHDVLRKRVVTERIRNKLWVTRWWRTDRHLFYQENIGNAIDHGVKAGPVPVWQPQPFSCADVRVSQLRVFVLTSNLFCVVANGFLHLKLVGTMEHRKQHRPMLAPSTDGTQIIRLLRAIIRDIAT